MGGHRLAVFVVLVLLGCTQRAATVPTRSPDLTEFDLLSIKLRGQFPTDAERAALARRISAAAGHDIYPDVVDEWLDAAAIRRISDDFVTMNVTTRSLFVGELSKWQREDGSWLYFLPHTLTPAQKEGRPCAAENEHEVVPWWAAGTRIKICDASYRPELVFDEVGYCGGQPEPTQPLPPRANCACGPLLLGCLPPTVEAPELVAKMNRDVKAEVAGTAATTIEHDGTYRDLVTASATWQTGLVRFLYLRRDLLHELQTRRFDAAVESEFVGRVRAIDLTAPGQMIQRGPPYAGSGVFVTTIYPGLKAAGYRPIAVGVFGRELCHGFTSVHVTSDALLLASAGVKDLRLKDIHLSPMRHTTGCKDCHAPLDNMAAFLAEVATPLYGSIPTGRRLEAQLYVSGAGDLRGSETGIDGLMRLITKQPEFDACHLLRFFLYFVGRPPTSDDTASLHTTLGESRSLRRLFKVILTSDAFRRSSPADRARGAHAP